ncbi:glycoside hydrolase [Xylariales sp. PMI_506]|nr:glycoside hydrolase [Xylariales sp. PMI_506]
MMRVLSHISSLLAVCYTLQSVNADTIAPDNTTAASDTLQTWWHDEGEINYQTVVEEGNVRQSHVYSIWAKSTSDSTETYYNSFVYETIPRNGQGNIIIPGDPSSVTTLYDAVTIEADIGITMAWTQFLYSSDTWIKVTRIGDNPSSADNVVIRPANLGFIVTDDGAGSVYILVPYTSKGYRFSVEFQDNLYRYHDSCATTTCDFVQDEDSSGPYYVSNFDNTTNPVMGIEPHDALLIFASPFPTLDLVPEESAPETYIVWPGAVPDLSSITNTAVYFTPGVYYMSATWHATLSSSVNWVYLAPGAYVKGAFQFTTAATTIKATGFGVLSGEQYVYQANTAEGYTNVQSNGDSLRMWSGYSTPGEQQTFLLNGLTTNSPPFNSIDFTGDINSISIHQGDYKQVGAYFGQTDGTTLYPGSSVQATFYHSGDDTIKTYGSNVSVSDVVVWKGKTAPIIQFGWASRNLDNITVTEIDVIHMRYSSNGSHPSIIGANQVYDYAETETDTADLENWVTNVYLGNIRAEGIGGNLMRICTLANYENFTIENVSLDAFSVRSNGIFESELAVFTDTSGNAVSISGFVISGLTVGGESVTQAAANYGPDAVGGLNIPAELLESSSVVIV